MHRFCCGYICLCCQKIASQKHIIPFCDNCSRFVYAWLYGFSPSVVRK
ncbi:MAG: hypothetical protein ACLTSK_04430 [Christensenellales bacterium]